MLTEGVIYILKTCITLFKKKKNNKTQFNYATSAVLSGIHIRSGTHAFCEYWAVKKWKEAEFAHA